MAEQDVPGQAEPLAQPLGPARPPGSRGRHSASPPRAPAAPSSPSRQQGAGLGQGGGGRGGLEATAAAAVGSMEGKRMSAVLSRFLFGPLAFQHVNSEADTGGFLLGEVKDVKDSMADTQWNDGDIVYIIDIQTSIACSQLFSFYDSAGEVDEQALKNVISCCGKNVIGWYKYRHISDHKTTYQEMILHQSIQKHLSNQKVVFLLLTPTVASESPYTHGLDYLLLHSTQEGLFEKIPLVVTDLEISEEEQYKTVTGRDTATAFCEIVVSHRSEFFATALKHVQKIREIYGNTQEELKKIRMQVLITEQFVETLLKDIDALKEELEKTVTTMNQAPGVQQDQQSDLLDDFCG